MTHIETLLEKLLDEAKAIRQLLDPKHEEPQSWDDISIRSRYQKEWPEGTQVIQERVAGIGQVTYTKGEAFPFTVRVEYPNGMIWDCRPEDLQRLP